MPYADPEKRREAQRRYFAKRYPAIADAETARKTAWKQTDGKELHNASRRKYGRKIQDALDELREPKTEA